MHLSLCCLKGKSVDKSVKFQSLSKFKANELSIEKKISSLIVTFAFVYCLLDGQNHFHDSSFLLFVEKREKHVKIAS